MRRNPTFTKSNYTPPVTQRFGTPQIQKGADGTPVMICPFCKPSHPLSLSGDSACGTRIEIRAVQTVIKGKYHKELVCVKCGKGGGNLVHFNNAFIHDFDCAPGVAAFVDQPAFSRAAAFVYKLPEWAQARLKKYVGESKSVEEVDEKGARTGKILGYFFYKRA